MQTTTNMTHIKEITEDSKKSISEIYEKEKVYVHTCASAMSHYVAQVDSKRDSSTSAS